jgi:hypothetical protein
MRVSTQTISLKGCVGVEILTAESRQDQTQGRDIQAAARSATYKAHSDVTRKIGNMVLVNSDYHTRKYFSENCLQYGLAPSKMFSNLVLGLKC